MYNNKSCEIEGLWPFLMIEGVRRNQKNMSGAEALDVPVIDLAAFKQEGQREAVKSKFRWACEEVGFLQVISMYTNNQAGLTVQIQFPSPYKLLSLP